MKHFTLTSPKNKMLYCLTLFLFLGLGLNSCSNDDSGIPTDHEQIIRVEDNPIATVPYHFTPKNTFPENTKFYWYNDQTLISEEGTFTHTFPKVGEYKIGLRAIENGIQRHYTYIFKVIAKDEPQYITLDLTKFDLSKGIPTAGGFYWQETYSETAKFSSQIFTFSHTGNESWNYWDGFTVSNSTGNVNHAEGGGSAGWLNYQWGNMAQGGVKGKGTPYIVGYWGYYDKDWNAEEGVFDEKKYSNWVKIEDGNHSFKATSVQIANHPWPYYGNLYGDGFARPFVKGDTFKITVHGVDKDNKVKPEVVTHYLADFRGDKLQMSQAWEKVDLKTLGEVKYIFFQLESTDSSPSVGPNTAVYFCMDQLTVEKIIK
ncbi:DUF4465 domain-containing protein [Flavobacterium sp. HSC-61S13]|uniref:DUF4465 domain-containing protein n=1 Tax=Flavobacterium sp. HSC-61S13 TaxID=2910963 RepID=UPI00209EFB96|nr:DUF4465 domain-containing protein [Flavobacterium sp. HSC-61S13]MCP1995361.1 hypothetical protein [Flavobacterium sp. HSC-61S13]